MANYTESEVVRDLAHLAYQPKQVEAGKHYVFVAADGELEHVDLTDDLPARKTGKVEVIDVASFLTYWGKHHDNGSEIYANLDADQIVAILDAHETSSARYQQHRLVLQLSETPQWVTWMSLHDKMVKQDAFAEFIDKNYGDVAPSTETIHLPGGVSFPNVSASDLRELAQHLTAHVDAKIDRGQRIDNGATTLKYEEDVTVKGGSKGEFPVPAAFLLNIRPYDDCPDDTRVIARVRTRIGRSDGTLWIGYDLFEVEKVQRRAFDDVVAKISAATNSGVMLGLPG